MDGWVRGCMDGCVVGCCAGSHQGRCRRVGGLVLHGQRVRTGGLCASGFLPTAYCVNVVAYCTEPCHASCVALFVDSAQDPTDDGTHQ